MWVMLAGAGVVTPCGRLAQTRDPICSVLVEMRPGEVLLKDKPALPVALPFLKGVQVTELRSTPSACVRYSVETASRAESV